MKLQKTIAYLLTLPLLSSVMAGCEDTIEPEDRYKPVVDSGEPARTVLIEEYTGIDCKNCPTGHERLKELEASYNTADNLSKGVGVIAVGIHIPAFGDAVADGGFVTPEATSLAPGQNTAPAARINRRTKALDIDAWPSAVRTEITRRPIITFPQLEATVAPGGTLTVSGTALADALITDARLQLWIVEDHIIDWQLMPDSQYNSEYEHHAVYRASLTGLAGREIELNRHTPEEFTIGGLTLSPTWNAANLRIVAFVETPDAGVLNAAQCSVTILSQPAE